MGQLITFKCEKCQNTLKFFEGVGELWHTYDKSMFYPPKNNSGLNFYNELDKSMLDEIHKFINSCDVIIDDVCYKPYICEKCGRAETKVYFKLENKTGEIYYPKYFCKCSNEYKILTEENQKFLRCSKCGKNMIRTTDGFWD